MLQDQFTDCANLVGASIRRPAGSCAGSYPIIHVKSSSIFAGSVPKDEGLQSFKEINLNIDKMRKLLQVAFSRATIELKALVTPTCRKFPNLQDHHRSAAPELVY